MKKLNYYLIFFLFSFSLNANESTLFKSVELNDSLVSFSPLKIELYLNIIDLKDVEIKNNHFTSSLWYELIFDKDIKNYSDEFKDPKIYTQLEFTKQPGSEVSDLFQYDSLSYIRKLDYTQFNHNWDVRNYPFDLPKLKFVFKSTLDTSFVKINPKKNIFADFESTKNLKDGFRIKNIDYEKEYVDVNNENIVLEELTFNVNLDRDGSWLFLKLFLGSFMAFIISWLVFLVSTNDFESRIELSVGAIFGAVGNRSYVESIIPDVQVLTIADLINNLIIFLIVFNIIIIMIQRNKKIHWSFFETNWNSGIYSLFLFIILNLAILTWSLPIPKVLFILVLLFLLYQGTKIPKLLVRFKKK